MQASFKNQSDTVEISKHWDSLDILPTTAERGHKSGLRGKLVGMEWPFPVTFQSSTFQC